MSRFLISGSGANVGVVTDRYQYTAWGVETPLNISGNPFRYTGRKLDADTGLYYYRARYYAPELGRFLQTDPIGYADQMNLYAYVENDPLNLVDPFGLYGTCAEFKEGAGNSQSCQELEATGKEFDTIDDAAKTVSEEMRGLQESTGNEWGVAFTENENGTVSPTVAVSGSTRGEGNEAGHPTEVQLNPLLEGTENPIGDGHTHAGSSNFGGGDINSSGTKGRRYTNSPGETYTSYVFRSNGFTDKMVFERQAIRNPVPGGATAKMVYQIYPEVFYYGVLYNSY